jgi:hypothetical protein
MRRAAPSRLDVVVSQRLLSDQKIILAMLTCHTLHPIFGLFTKYLASIHFAPFNLHVTALATTSRFSSYMLGMLLQISFLVAALHNSQCNHENQVFHPILPKKQAIA